MVELREHERIVDADGGHGAVNSNAPTDIPVHGAREARPVTGWNFADVWEVVADRLPESPALLHGARVIDWRTFDAHADGIASALLGAGLERQDKVAHYLYN